MNIAKNRERRARRWSFEGRRKSRHAGRYMRCRYVEEDAGGSCYGVERHIEILEVDVVVLLVACCG
jgi:hypothetical protein